MGIAENSRGNLWIGTTGGGINQLDPSRKHFSHYTMEDGLQSDEFNYGSYYKSEKGEMFFGGTNGFNAFFPKNIKGNDYIPPVMITRIKTIFFLFNLWL